MRDTTDRKHEKPHPREQTPASQQPPDAHGHDHGDRPQKRGWRHGASALSVLVILGVGTTVTRALGSTDTRSTARENTTIEERSQLDGVLARWEIADRVGIQDQTARATRSGEDDDPAVGVRTGTLDSTDTRWATARGRAVTDQTTQGDDVCEPTVWRRPACQESQQGGRRFDSRRQVTLAVRADLGNIAFAFETPREAGGETRGQWRWTAVVSTRADGSRFTRFAWA